jgi:hypothetical protein
MANAMSVDCPGCQARHTDDSIPNMQDWYTFTCPASNQNIATPAGIVTMGQRIPADGIVATLAE